MPELKPKIPADYSVPSLSQVTVVAGGTARFRCKVQRADSTFRWRKNGVLISVDQSERLEIRVRTRKGKSVGALIVRKASDSDSGCYSCETNGANQTLNRTSWRLDVTEGLCLSVQYCTVRSRYMYHRIYGPPPLLFHRILMYDPLYRHKIYKHTK